MKEIYVLNENGQPELISAGVERYEELQNAPINISKREETKLNPVKEEELVAFCESLPDGRYDIFTEKNGPEWLFIDRSKGTEDEPNRFRRITLDSDLIYSYLAEEWVYISDQNAKALVASIVNYADINNKMVVVGSKVTIDCYYYSTYGPGVINIYDKDGMLKFSSGIISGETVKADVSNYIVDGDQSFRVIISNESEAKDFNMLVGITGIQLTYKPIFNQYSANFTGNVQFSFEYYGTGNKQVYFEVNGEPVVFSSGVSSYPNASGSDTVIIPAQYFTTGENTIKTYLYIEDNGELVTKTDELIYRVPWWDTEENTTPIVMTYFAFENIKEYDTISIPYYIWAKSAAQRINLSLEYEQDGVLKTIDQLYTDENDAHKINYLTQNTQHNWQLSNLPWGNLTFKIYLNDSTEPVYVSNTVSVEKSKIDLGPTKGGLVLNFLPTDVTSTDAMSEWSDGLGNTMKLDGFNWQTDGFKTDDDSNKALVFSTNASATIEGFKLFDKNGFSFEIDYMVHDAIVETKPIIRYGHMNNTETRLYGIDVYPIRTVFNVDGSANKGEDFVLNFQKGERVHLMYVYENGSGTSRYVKLYINGILSLVDLLPSIGDSMAQPENLTINLQSNTISLYALRAYNKALSSKEVIQNYASNFGNVDKKTELIRLNNIYASSDTDNPRQLSCTDKDGNIYEFPGESVVKYDAVKGKISTFVVIAPALPDSKLYVPFDKIIFDDLGPTNDGTTKWITWAEQDLNKQKGNVFQGQGTSSLVYPRKNFKFKFKKKLQIKGDGLVNEKGKPISGAEKNFTFKCDYMDSSGANNIGNAIVTQNSIRTEDWVGTPIAEGARLNLDGFPVAMFWAKEYETNEKGENIPVNPEYIGTYNFNYDKKIKSVGRYEDENYPFQGFEFRSNTSTECLQTGIRNFTSFMNGNDGYEWRWTPLTDWVDDYHDKKNLVNTMQGGLFTTTDTPDGKYITNIHTDAEYLYDRTLDEKDELFKEITRVPAYSAWYWKDGEQKHRLYYIDGNDLYKELDYRQIPGCSDDVFEVEYGIRVVDGKIYWQIPYGRAGEDLGKFYPTEEIEEAYRTKYAQGYYEFEFNKEHEAKFKLFKHCDYYKDLTKWNELISAENLYYKEYSVASDTLGEYLLDKDGEYYKISDYPHCNYDEETGKYVYDESGQGTHIQVSAKEFVALSELTPENTYNLSWKYVNSADLTDDSLIIDDIQKKIFKNWFYCVDALSHCDVDNYKQLMDSASQDPNNGQGLFRMSALLNYFVSSLTTAVCDNFCKNMFMHTYDGGQTWVPAWYDMDTAYGLNNVGLYAYNYDIDFDNGIVDENGIIKKAGSFNGSDSTLWSLFYKLYLPNIESEYSILRTADKISYNKIMDVLYGENIKYKFPALYNANAFYRYIIPNILKMSDNHLEAGQGSRYELLKYWNRNREYYVESRYNGGSFVNSKITLRINCDEEAKFELTPGVNMYVGVAVDNQDAATPAKRSDTKILAGETWSYITNRGSSFSDTNTYIFGANNLLDVGDMGQWVASTCNLATATNLQKINLGMKKGSVPYNTYQTAPKIQQDGQTVTLSQTPYNNLTELNLENCDKLVNTRLDFSTIGPVLEDVVLTGSNVQQIQFAEYSPLKSVYYPASLNVVKLINLPELKTVEFESYENLTGINIKGTPNFDSLNLLTELYNKGFINNLNTINADLYGTYDTAIDFDMLKDLYNKKAELGGVVYVKHVNEEELQPYRDYWKAHGGLVIEWHQIFHDDAILGIEGESTSQITRTYGAKELTNTFAYKDTFAVLNDFDSTVIGQKLVDEDEVNHPGWIKINPFYTAYITDNSGKITGRSISEFKISNEYMMNPMFVDEQGVVGPIYISKYLEHDSSNRPIAQTPQAWHNQLQDLTAGDELYRYTVETIWTRQLLQDLVLIEFARTDMSEVMPGSPKISQVGETDSLSYHTGIAANQGGNLSTSFKYRGLEDIWRGGTRTYVQGIQTNTDGWLYVTTNDYFPTSLDNWRQLNNRPTSSGVRYLKSFVVENIDGQYCITVPRNVELNNVNSTYKDQININTSSDTIGYTSCGGGAEDMTHGLWSMHFSTSKDTKLYGRLVRRYKNNRVTSIEPKPQE